MSKIGGIIKMSNKQKEVIIKLEDIIGFHNDIDVSIDLRNNDDCSILRLNGITLSESANVKYVDTSSAIVTLSLNDYKPENDTYKVIQMNVGVDGSETYKFPIYITDNVLEQYNTYDKHVQMIASNMESFMLLRTNPKLTGNVKLVVSEDYNLYLDTFKISQNSILNKQEYRHQAISADGDYAHDVYKVFNVLPSTEMYGIYPDSYDPHMSYHKMDDQIRNIYEYGAEYNSDMLYSENMKILAPLYIGKHLPTYFAIWRTDRLITTDNIQTNSQIFKDLLNSGQCIKIFDLRQSTTIGKYLNNYQNTINKYFAGSCALQFIEQDNDKNSADHRQGQNTWKGIAYDKGILTDRNETTYFATKTLEGENPQENYDMFLINGFSRNNLLFPNILNLEFMFNDNDAEDFSMHNYFGLYLTENDFLQFNQVIKNGSNDDNYTLTYYDANNNIVKLDSTPIDIIENDEYKDRLFFASTKTAATNLSSMKDFNLFVKNEAANKPYENLLQLNGNQLQFNDSQKAFLTIDFTKQIRYGEHFKFIIPKYQIDKNAYQHIVFEIVASNDNRLKNTANNISQYVQTNTTRNTLNDNDNNTCIYRIAFYTQSLDNDKELADLQDQIKRICSAITKFNNVLSVGSNGPESMSVISSVKDVYFQHIMADEYDENSIIDDTLRYYNYNNIQKCENIEYITDLYGSEFVSYANNGLEEILKRYANITKFVNIDDIDDKFVYEIDKDIYEETNKIAWPLIYTVNNYYPIIKFTNNDGNLTFDPSANLTITGDSWVTIVSPFNVQKSIICSPFEAELINDQINICSPMQLNVALMGINSIKDLDLYINNDIQEKHYTSATASFNAGEQVKIDNSDPRIRQFVTYSVISGSILGIPVSALNSFTILPDKIIYTNVNQSSPYEIELQNDYIQFGEDTTIMLVSTNSLDLYNYTVSYPVLNEDNYYIDKTDKNNSKLSIPIVPLINCQWKSNGTYFDTVSMLDVNNLINDYDIIGNFVECQYTPGASNQYVIDSIHDIINVNNNAQTIHDYIIETGNIKKYLCSNSKIQTAIGYYNPYVQTLEFIFYGIKFILKLTSNEYTNEIKLNEFNNYEVYIINDYDGTNTNEIIISKKEEFILIINHIYKSSYYYSNDSVKMYKNGIIQDVIYDWYKMPFNYEMKSTSYFNDKIYVNKSDSYILQDIENIKTFIELDLDIYDKNGYAGFNEEPNYAYFTIDSSLVSKLYYDMYDSSANLYIETDNTIYNSAYDLLAQKYRNVDIDFRQKNGYIVKENNVSNTELASIPYDEKLNNYVSSFNGNYKIYIIENDTNIQTDIISITNDYKPLSIQLITPNKVKYNNGLFNPNFVDIFNFELNDPISKELQIDTLYGNTLLSSIDSIKNYYCNKVLEGQSTYTFNYFAEAYRSPFSTNWDNNIYRSYTSDEDSKYLPGYSIGVDDKMFFGSKVLNLHNDGILLTTWNYKSNNDNNARYSISKQNEHTKAKRTLQIVLNLTKTFYNYCINQKEFINNWALNTNAINAKIYINNYINNVLYNIYNFKGNFDVTLYKKYDENVANGKALAHFIKNNALLSEYEIETNYKTEFKDINNEVILVITINDYENYIYYPTVKINKN